MKWISAASIREAEQEAFEQRGVDPYRLMCRAGAAVANTAANLARTINTNNVLVVAGHGNNAGDAFVAARCLHDDGFRVRVLMTCLPSLLRDSARRAWSDMSTQGVTFTPITTNDGWLNDPWMDSSVYPRDCVIVDGLLGTGTRGPARGIIAVAINWMNQRQSQSPVLSIDIPSGLEADTGNAPTPTVRADVTVTFSRPKLGFINPEARPYLGHLDVVNIGIPDDILDSHEQPQDLELLSWPELKKIRTPRPIAAHKGDFGHALIIGGSSLYPNAPVLSTYAALRAGAGRVTLAAPEESLLALSTHIPEAIFLKTSIPTDLCTHDLTPYSAIAIGPGIGVSPETEALVDHLVNKTNARLVLDADALTALANLKHSGWKQIVSESTRLIITPHPGEAARLLKTDIKSIQADRASAVKELANTYNAITVLKGSGSLICAPNSTPWLASVGNPGMATAGSGDVLTGIITGLLAKRYGCFNATSLAVWLHGTTGDLMAFKYGEEALTALMIATNLRL